MPKSCSREADRQWKVAAQLHGLRHRILLRRNALRPGDAFEEFDRLRAGQHAHRENVGAFEAGKPAAAGNQDRARPARQQRPHLFGRRGVVKHDDCLAPSGFRAPERGPVLGFARDARGVDPELKQQSVQCHAGVERIPPGRMAM